MLTFDYDLFVIGAGSGGVRAARIAAGHGARVAIAEEFRYGGTCVIRGCVPKKLLVYASRFSDEFSDAVGFGWSLDAPSFDWPSLIAAKDAEITRLEGIYKSGLDAASVDVIADRAEISGANAVALKASGRTITAKTILVATGGTPTRIDALPGAAYAITSNEVFNLPSQPRHIVIVGGGYIAVEFASIFAGLGSKVTLVYRGDTILRGFDDDLRHELTDALRRRGVDVVTNAELTQITRNSAGLTTTLTTGASVVCDQVMLAIGRQPNTQGLGLETAGVAVDKIGAVSVNDQSQSSVASIYAVGDVTDRVALTPVAIREGHAFADTVFGRVHWTVDYDTIPTAVFTTPEIGTVGLTEADARAKHGDVIIYASKFRPMRAVVAGRADRTLMKMIVRKSDDKVLGVHIIGPDAAEIVQMAAIALRMGATKADFDSTMALHPSASEELVTMRG